MLSADDVKKFIELKRYELDKEKRTLSAVKFTSPICKETESLGGGSINGESSLDSSRDSRRTGAPVSRNEQKKDYSEELKINVYSEDSDLNASIDSVDSRTRKVEEVKCSARKGSEQEEEATVDTNRLLKKCPTSPPMGMLRVGEFSPNHPDIALSSRPLEGGQRDVFVGLGLYEERRKELLQRRQKEYREYLAQQRTMNALAKQQLHSVTMGAADNFHHPHHQVNQDHLKSFLSPAGGWQSEWRGQHPVEQANPVKQQPPDTPEDMFHHPHHQVNQDHLQSFLSPAGGWQGEWGGRHGGVGRRPSSVAVQTDPENMMAIDRRLTQAERELSPRPIPNSPPIRSRYLPDREQIPRLQQIQALQTRSQGYPSNPQSQAYQGLANPQCQQQDWRMLVEKVNIGTQNNLIVPTNASKYLPSTNQEDNFTGGYFDQAMNGMGKNIFRKDSPRARLLQDLRHTYMPSLFDEDAIKQRNEEMEQDAAAKRAAYQLDLKKQIDEQHRIKEERKRHEKMLEEAETRRLEEQLKLLKLSQETEMDKQQQLAIRIRKDSNEFERRRLKLHTDIENEKKAMRMARNQPRPPPDSPTRATRSNPVGRTNVPNNEVENRSNLPFYYTSPRLENNELEPEILSYNVRRNNPHLGQDPSPKRVPFSTNIPDNSIFAQSIPVKNYNIDDLATNSHSNQRNNNNAEIKDKKRHNIEVEHRRIKEDVDKFNRNRRNPKKYDRPSYEPAFLSKNITEMIDTKNLTKSRNYNANFDDSLPIPVLREPEKNIKIQNEFITEEQNHTSDAMRNVEEKWKVPAVQKNILKNNFSPDGKQENILTQLGSIRRQLQLEQLKLDQSQMFPKQKMVK